MIPTVPRFGSDFLKAREARLAQEAEAAQTAQAETARLQALEAARQKELAAQQQQQKQNELLKREIATETAGDKTLVFTGKDLLEKLNGPKVALSSFLKPDEEKKAMDVIEFFAQKGFLNATYQVMVETNEVVWEDSDYGKSYAREAVTRNSSWTELDRDLKNNEHFGFQFQLSPHGQAFLKQLATAPKLDQQG